MNKINKEHGKAAIEGCLYGMIPIAYFIIDILFT